MNRLSVLIVIICVSLCITGFLRGQEADDIYLNVYELIQQGENLLGMGNKASALSKFIEAQNELKKLSAKFPDWNVNVVKYRLNYLAEKIKSISAEVPLPQSETKPEQTNAASIVKEQVSSQQPQQIDELKRQLLFFQQQIFQLKSEKEQLESKLKEALSVQPAAVDPGEIARANERIRNLEKQVDLLQITINQERERASKLIEPSAFAAVQKALAETTEKLEKATKEVSTLVAEKQNLEKTLKEERAKATRKTDQSEVKKLEEKLAELNRKLDAQVKTASSLKKENDELKKLLKAKNPDLSKMEALAKENESLKRELSELKTSKTASAANDISKEILALREQLNIMKGKYEALRVEKELLEAQLKENASVTSPTEAEARMKDLEKRLSIVTESAVANEARIKSLIAEKEAAEKARLEAEKKLEESKLQIERLKVLEQELLSANRRAEEYSKKTAELEKEKSMLEKRLASLITEQQSALAEKSKNEKQIKELQKERDDLQKKLNALNKELNNIRSKSQTVKITDLEEQVATLRSRVEVYEAKAVPYSAEELALFKKPELSQARAEQASPRAMRELPPTAGKLVVEAQADAESGRLKQAETKLQEALKYDSAHLSTLFRLASVQLEQNKLDEAEQTIKRALSIDPQDAGALFLLGVLNDQRGNLDAAIDAFSRSAKNNSNNPDTQIYLGLTLSKKGLRSQAETAFRKALQIQPGNPIAHMNLAVIYANQNPPFIELAKWHYQKALSNGAKKNEELERKLYPNTQTGANQGQ